ncbi:membrane protein [Planobispora rosea]|uniref:Membrane protein n=2 Tax=Planobispora rosea TaxID=35762 RepID=A0A8J3RXU9_PLARO|nr:DUF2752 domain-containing protein [Planobispora rosea]GGS53555.1 membrane protein [Planobispora rosea]GIH82630.1 membrane protein [Planobispora rosea]
MTGGGPAGPGGAVAGRSRRWAPLAPLGVALAAGAGVAFVAAVDPNEPGHYPSCPFLVLTGLYCPGCGGLRAVYALAHGDPVAAFGLNPFLVLALPFALLLWGRWAVRSWLSRRGGPVPGSGIRPVYPWVLLGLMIAFWIARNLPSGEFLAP